MESIPPNSGTEESVNLRAQVAALSKTLFTVLVCLVGVSVTLNIFLWRQVHYTRADLNMLRQQAAAQIAEYQQTSGPKMDAFVKQLQDYTKLHPDFKEIAAKYGLSATSAPAPKK